MLGKNRLYPQVKGDIPHIAPKGMEGGWNSPRRQEPI